MAHPTTRQILMGALLLQTGAIAGAILLPNATAQEFRSEPRFSSPLSGLESPSIAPTSINVEREGPVDLTCRHFEMSREEMTGETGGQFETANMDGAVGGWVHPLEEAGWRVHSTDFEVGSSVSGRPTWWVQVCLSKEKEGAL